jgi:uroporphyrinogen-III synthase
MTPRRLRAKVAAVGDGTAERFRTWSGRDPDLVPKAFTTEALGRAFPRGNGRVLTPRADVAPEGLEGAAAEATFGAFARWAAVARGGVPWSI